MAKSESSRMATSDRIEELILDGPPYRSNQEVFLSVNDISEELDVSKETVRNHVGDVANHPLIRERSVGQAMVYWRTSEPDDGWFDGLEDGETEEFAEKVMNERRNKLIGARARWLETEQQFLNGDLDRSSPHDRWEMWGMLTVYLDYLDRLGTVSFGTALKKQPLPDEYGDLDGLEQYDADGQALPRGYRVSSFQNRLYKTHLFDSPFDTEVRGIVMLYPHFIWTRDQLGDDPDEETLDEVLPSAKNIHYAGSVLDQFVAQLHGFYW